MHYDEDGFGATISDLRRKGERRHMNGNYKGAYEAFRKAARTSPEDRELWDEYAKAFSNLQQQMEDKEARAPAGYSSISREMTSTSTDEFGPETTGNISEIGSQSIRTASQSQVASPKAMKSGSVLVAVNEDEVHTSRTFQVPGVVVGAQVGRSATELQKKAVWSKNKFQFAAYAMWLITILTVVFHFISGWLQERDMEPMEPVLTLAVLLLALSLLWRFGQNFASGLVNTTKAVSAFALAVITVGHWVAFWTQVHETSSNSTSTNSTITIVFS